MDAKARAQAARERARLYREGGQVNEPAPEPAASGGVRDLDEWNDIVSRRIKEAMRDGAFDNLPGHGKPVDSGGDPFVPQDRQMAFKLLENNRLIPSWIGDRKAILAAIERLRDDIEKSVRAYRIEAAQTTEADHVQALAQQWSHTVERWESRVVDLNKRIVSQNLQQPADHLEILQLRLADELKRAGATRELG